ncbi:MAG: agmatinase [Methanomassiliicoccales archaeon]|nr:agmatinase [Methanomassiliicoccales archaeon]
MVLRGVNFAFATASFEKAEFVIVGVPFDRTTSFRSGARAGPNAIREASYNFEPYVFEHDLLVTDVAIHDAGNIEDLGHAEDMIRETKEVVSSIIKAGKFPILVGGEHTITIPAVQAHKDIGVITVDAHLDFRDEYMNNKFSHACVLRRNADHVGIENVLAFGVRSISIDEKKAKMPEYIDAYAIHEEGVEKAFKRALNMMRRENIYFSLDIDGIDPAYAPGTGTPEPFGLTSMDVKRCINMLGPRLIGFDVVEVSPPYDKGNTAGLAARMIIEAIAVVHKHRHRK